MDRAGHPAAAGTALKPFACAVLPDGAAPAGAETGVHDSTHDRADTGKGERILAAADGVPPPTMIAVLHRCLAAERRLAATVMRHASTSSALSRRITRGAEAQIAARVDDAFLAVSEILGRAATFEQYCAVLEGVLCLSLSSLADADPPVTPLVTAAAAVAQPWQADHRLPDARLLHRLPPRAAGLSKQATEFCRRALPRASAVTAEGEPAARAVLADCLPRLAVAAPLDWMRRRAGGDADSGADVLSDAGAFLAASPPPELERLVRQDRRDYERDVCVVDGTRVDAERQEGASSLLALVLSEEGLEDVVAEATAGEKRPKEGDGSTAKPSRYALAKALLVASLRRRSHLTGWDATQCERGAAALLHAAARTQTGGDSLEAAMSVLGRPDLAALTPRSADAAAISIRVGTGRYAGRWGVGARIATRMTFALVPQAAPGGAEAEAGPLLVVDAAFRMDVLLLPCPNAAPAVAARARGAVLLSARRLPQRVPRPPSERGDRAKDRAPQSQTQQRPAVEKSPPFRVTQPAGPIPADQLPPHTELTAWGRGRGGVLGVGDAQERTHPAPIAFDRAMGLVRVTQVACSWFHSMAVTETGLLYTWGSGLSGCLGHGDDSPSLRPRLVQDLAFRASGPARVRHAAAGADLQGAHSSAVADDGSLFTWGVGYALGRGLLQGSARPRRVDADHFGSARRVRQVACGGGFTVALCTDGAVFTWGKWAQGRLGLGLVPRSQESTATGVQFSRLGRALSGTQGEQPRALAGGGADPTARAQYQLLPARVTALRGATVVQVACGLAHCAAVEEHGRLFTWGRGGSGQLGTGSTADSFFPRLVELPLPSRDVDGGSMDVAAPETVADDQWVDAEPRQFRRGTLDLSAPPEDTRRPRVAAVACGSSHTLCIDGAGRVWAWGGGGGLVLGDARGVALNTSADNLAAQMVAQQQACEGSQGEGDGGGGAGHAARARDVPSSRALAALRTLSQALGDMVSVAPDQRRKAEEKEGKATGKGPRWALSLGTLLPPASTVLSILRRLSRQADASSAFVGEVEGAGESEEDEGEGEGGSRIAAQLAAESEAVLAHLSGLCGEDEAGILARAELSARDGRLGPATQRAMDCLSERELLAWLRALADALVAKEEGRRGGPGAAWTAPRVVPGPWCRGHRRRALSVSAGATHSAVVLRGGDLLLWGAHRMAEGRADAASNPVAPLVPHLPRPGAMGQPCVATATVEAVACGGWHTVAVTSGPSLGDALGAVAERVMRDPVAAGVIASSEDAAAAARGLLHLGRHSSEWAAPRHIPPPFGRCDATLVVGGGQGVHAHTLLLAARSPRLASLIQRERTARRTGHVQLLLPDLSHMAGLAVVEFIYTDSVPHVLVRNPGMGAELRIAARRYELPRLAAFCDVVCAGADALHALEDAVEDAARDDATRDAVAPAPPVPPSSLGRELAALFADRETADVLLRARDGVLPAHCIILCARSSYWRRRLRAMGEESGSEGPGVAPPELRVDASAASLSVVLHWLYTGVLGEGSAHKLLDAMLLAYAMDLPALIDTCASALTLDASLFWRALSVAYATQSPLLRELCWAWTLGNAVPPLPHGGGGSDEKTRATERLLDRELFRHLSARAQVASSASTMLRMVTPLEAEDLVQAALDAKQEAQVFSRRNESFWKPVLAMVATLAVAWIPVQFASQVPGGGYIVQGVNAVAIVAMMFFLLRMT